jgi:acyl dehydratase
MSDTDTSGHELITDQRGREASGAHPYGRYLEDFEVGAVYKHWPAKTITSTTSMPISRSRGGTWSPAHTFTRWSSA